MDSARRSSASQRTRRGAGGSVPMIDAVFVQMACQVLELAGADPKAVLAEVGLKPEILAEEDPRIPFRQNVQFLERAAVSCGDSCFGLHLAAALKSDNIGVLGYVATASSTVSDAIRNVQLFYQVLTDGEIFESRIEGNQLIVDYRVLDVAAQHSRQNDDMSLLSILRFLEIITGKRLFAEWVESKHSTPAQASEYARLFGAPVHFGAARNAIAFPAKLLETPIHSADDRLLLILKNHCQTVLKARGEEADLVRQVEEMALRLLPGGAPKAEEVAKALGMSLRTLSRRLQEHDVTYRDLLDELRSSLAERYLHDRKLRLSEIAYLLGYADLSTFNHAFNRWTGKSPTEYRQLAA